MCNDPLQPLYCSNTRKRILLRKRINCISLANYLSLSISFYLKKNAANKTCLLEICIAHFHEFYTMLRFLLTSQLFSKEAVFIFA